MTLTHTSKLEEGVAASTAQKRISILNRLVGDAKDFTKLDRKAIAKALAGYKNVDTRYTVLMHIHMASKAYPEQFSQDTLKYLQETIGEQKKMKVAKQNNNVKSPKQAERLDRSITDYQRDLIGKIDALFEEYNIRLSKANALTAATIRDLGDRMLPFMKRFQDLMYMVVYVLQESIRANWATMKYATNARSMNDEDNWMLLGRSNDIHMNHFKNVAHMGSTVIHLNPATQLYMSAWMSGLKHALGKKPEYVLHYKITRKEIEHIGSEPGLAKNIPRVAKRLFGKEMTINDWRHLHEIYIQHEPAYADLTIEERDMLHKKLLHGTRIAQYYNVQDAK